MLLSDYNGCSVRVGDKLYCKDYPDWFMVIERIGTFIIVVDRFFGDYFIGRFPIAVESIKGGKWIKTWRGL